MKRAQLKWYIEHIPNLIIRLCTFDLFYVCDECHKIHKRNGKEIDLGDPNGIGTLLTNKWWYGSVYHECYCEVMNKAFEIMSEAVKEVIK